MITYEYEFDPAEEWLEPGSPLDMTASPGLVADQLKVAAELADTEVQSKGSLHTVSMDGAKEWRFRLIAKGLWAPAAKAESTKSSRP